MMNSSSWLFEVMLLYMLALQERKYAEEQRREELTRKRNERQQESIREAEKAEQKRARELESARKKFEASWEGKRLGEIAGFEQAVRELGLPQSLADQARSYIPHVISLSGDVDGTYVHEIYGLPRKELDAQMRQLKRDAAVFIGANIGTVSADDPRLTQAQERLRRWADDCDGEQISMVGSQTAIATRKAAYEAYYASEPLGAIAAQDWASVGGAAARSQEAVDRREAELQSGICDETRHTDARGFDTAMAKLSEAVAKRRQKSQQPTKEATTKTKRGVKTTAPRRTKSKDTEMEF